MPQHQLTMNDDSHHTHHMLQRDLQAQLAGSVVTANWLVQSVNAHCSPCVPPSVTYRILKIPARAKDLTLAYSWASTQSKHFYHLQLFFVGPSLFFVHACSDAPQIRTTGMTRCELPLPWWKDKYSPLNAFNYTANEQSYKIFEEI